MVQDTDIAKQTKQLLNWFNTPLGIALTQMEQACLDTILPQLPGYHLLSLGTILAKHRLHHSPISHQLYAAPAPQASAPSMPAVYSDYHHLPFQPDSLDVVIAPHVLEFHPNPLAILQEIWRILIPEGRLILFCLQRYSLWGLWQGLGARGPLWQGNFFSQSGLHQQLTATGLAPLQMSTLFFRPPINELRWLQKLQFCEKLGKTSFNRSGAVILTVAKKQLATLTPLKPCWHQQQIKIINGELEPTTRNLQSECNDEKN